MKIVPAILAEDFSDFTSRLREAETFVDYVQIDIMDGVFVETRSFPVEKINTVSTTLTFEAHLMVEDPLSAVSKIVHPGLKKAIFHFEASSEPLGIIRRIQERHLVPGLAIKPQTGIDEFREIGRHVDTLLFLAVDPGNYGHPFRPEVLKKIAEARRVFPDKAISVDGGVSRDNLKTFFDMGVDSVCVGSRIFLNGDPRENYRLFLRKLEEFERT